MAYTQKNNPVGKTELTTAELNKLKINPKDRKTHIYSKTKAGKITRRKR